MSLVAYATSSDDESSNDEEIPEKLPNDSTAATLQPSEMPSTSKQSFVERETVQHSDHMDEPLQFKLNLPAPTQISSIDNIDEKDDEFLHKKAIATQLPPKKIVPKKRETVKITIPALSEYDDNKTKGKLVTVAPSPNLDHRSCKLLGLLPKPKTEFQFSANKKQSTTSMVPHSVAKKQVAPSTSTSAKNLSQSTQSKAATATTLVSHASDTDEDDDDDEDFFSLNTDVALPEANLQKINELVANKMATMSKRTQNKSDDEPTSTNEMLVQESVEPTATKMDRKTMEALCGSSAKRARHLDDVNIIDLSGDQVLPNRDDWLRQQLTSTTEYQPRGLVDEEPAVGTRKKHQITYLAHQARANEQELQAMWAANRHARRLTQNKYGF